jgi:hypothetical protein
MPIKRGFIRPKYFFCPLDVVVAELHEVIEEEPRFLPRDRRAGILLLLLQQRTAEVLATAPQLVRE